MVSCDWQCRVKSQGHQVKLVDYLPLEKNDAARERFYASVARHMNDYPCDLDNTSASLACLTKGVSAAACETLPVNLSHKCESCAREFTKLRGLKIHMARWCDGGRTQRSRVGSLTDKAVKSSKRRAAEPSLDKVAIGSDPPLENVPQRRGRRTSSIGDRTVGV